MQTPICCTARYCAGIRYCMPWPDVPSKPRPPARKTFPTSAGSAAAQSNANITRSSSGLKKFLPFINTPSFYSDGDTCASSNDSLFICARHDYTAGGAGKQEQQQK